MWPSALTSSLERALGAWRSGQLLRPTDLEVWPLDEPDCTSAAGEERHGSRAEWDLSVTQFRHLVATLADRYVPAADARALSALAARLSATGALAHFFRSGCDGDESEVCRQFAQVASYMVERFLGFAAAFGRLHQGSVPVYGLPIDLAVVCAHLLQCLSRGLRDLRNEVPGVWIQETLSLAGFLSALVQPPMLTGDDAFNCATSILQSRGVEVCISIVGILHRHGQSQRPECVIFERALQDVGRTYSPSSSGADDETPALSVGQFLPDDFCARECGGSAYVVLAGNEQVLLCVAETGTLFPAPVQEVLQAFAGFTDISVHLATLGLRPGATYDEATSVFRRLAKQHHPDKGGDVATFQRIRAAFEGLTCGSYSLTFSRREPGQDISGCHVVPRISPTRSWSPSRAQDAGWERDWSSALSTNRQGETAGSCQQTIGGVGRKRRHGMDPAKAHAAKRPHTSEMRPSKDTPFHELTVNGLLKQIWSFIY